MPSPVRNDVREVLFTDEQIRERVRELGRQLSRDYAGRSPTLVGVLKGSIVFLSDLLRSFEGPCSVDFVCLSSYDGERSTGVVKTVVDLGQNPRDKDLVVVEDIVDTGLTLQYLLDSLRGRGARSVEVCCLLDKPERRRAQVDVRYTGFRIPDKFVVGYGLDYNEKYRNLPFIGVLDPKALP